MDGGSPEMKRNSSLHAKGKEDKVVEIVDQWKAKKPIPGARKNTMQRLFEPASNVTREKEEGCMNKIKIERSLKLREEDQRGRKFNVLTGASDKPQDWISSFGEQKHMVKTEGSSNVRTENDMKSHWKQALAAK